LTRIETACNNRPGAGGVACLRVLAVLVFVLAGLLSPSRFAHAHPVELASLEVTRNEDSVLLSFTTRFELPRGVEDALQKGVPLHFVAEADVYRSRWYWRDVRVSRVSRTWRLAWQPLTRSYRVSFGGLNQHFEALGDAMAALRGVARWKIADGAQLEEGARHYVELRYRLDTSQLPRPMQIGLAGQSEWSLVLEHSARIE
jgi:Domain of unknown function (DUF4390)